MGSLIATIILFAILFGTAFVMRRRFGVLGLALCAGALLSLNWAGTLTPFLEKQGVVLITPPLSALVEIGLTLAPPFLLLFSGPTYTKMLGRIVGAAAFALLSVTFLVDILASILVLDPMSSGLFQFLHDNKSVLVVAGIIGALVDVLLTRKPKGHRADKKAAH
jgi:hypothetical protein